MGRHFETQGAGHRAIIDYEQRNLDDLLLILKNNLNICLTSAVCSPQQQNLLPTQRSFLGICSVSTGLELYLVYASASVLQRDITCDKSRLCLS